jgi:hypothetical protein
MAKVRASGDENHDNDGFEPIRYYSRLPNIPEKLSELLAFRQWVEGDRIFMVAVKGAQLLPGDENNPHFTEYSTQMDTWRDDPRVVNDGAPLSFWEHPNRLTRVWERYLRLAMTQPGVSASSRVYSTQYVRLYRFVRPEVQKIYRESPIDGMPYELRLSLGGVYYVNKYVGENGRTRR